MSKEKKSKIEGMNNVAADGDLVDDYKESQKNNIKTTADKPNKKPTFGQPYIEPK